MDQPNKDISSKALKVFQGFEKLIVIVLSAIVGLIILISLVRLVENFYQLFFLDIMSPNEITFEDYQQLFGKIMTLLISLEFLASIIKVLKTHVIRDLILDVVLITTLAIARKLIVFDYEHHDSTSIIAMGILLVSTSVTYFLIKYAKKQTQAI